MIHVEHAIPTHFPTADSFVEALVDVATRNVEEQIAQEPDRYPDGLTPENVAKQALWLCCLYEADCLSEWRLKDLASLFEGGVPKIESAEAWARSTWNDTDESEEPESRDDSLHTILEAIAAY